jgi:Membrane dipeptidase (Peptidase family M19)
MWVDFISRAYTGGLRVMVALATNSKTLGDLASGKGDLPTDDLSSGDFQINALKQFVSRHSDFMEVALSSSDISRIVLENKLAVVIGVELDNIGNLGVVTSANRVVISNVDVGANNSMINGATGCDLLQTATASSLVAEVDRLYSEGVRYIFPIHLVDNAIGGTAAYPPDLFDTANLYEEGHPWNLICSTQGDGIGYTYAGGVNLIVSTAEQIKLGFSIAVPGPISCPITLPSGEQSGPGNVNMCGLTPAGPAAIQEMMHNGMLIDVDHMSHASAEQTIALAQLFTGAGFPGYPLIVATIQFVK